MVGEKKTYCLIEISEMELNTQTPMIQYHFLRAPSTGMKRFFQKQQARNPEISFEWDPCGNCEFFKITHI